MSSANYSRVWQIAELLHPKPDDLINTSRFFVREGELLLWNDKKRKKKPRYFYLFNDILLITKKLSHKRFILQIHVTLRSSSVSVENVPTSQTEIRLHCRSRSFMIFAPTADLKEAWVEDIKASIDGTHKEEGGEDGSSSKKKKAARKDDDDDEIRDFAIDDDGELQNPKPKARKKKVPRSSTAVQPSQNVNSLTDPDFLKSFDPFSANSLAIGGGGSRSSMYVHSSPGFGTSPLLSSGGGFGTNPGFGSTGVYGSNTTPFGTPAGGNPFMSGATASNPGMQPGGFGTNTGFGGNGGNAFGTQPTGGNPFMSGATSNPGFGGGAYGTQPQPQGGNPFLSGAQPQTQPFAQQSFSTGGGLGNQPTSGNLQLTYGSSTGGNPFATGGQPQSFF